MRGRRRRTNLASISVLPYAARLWRAGLRRYSPTLRQPAGRPLVELVQDLKSPDVQVRRDAAYALAELGPSAAEAAPALVEALRDQDTQVWASAAQALGLIGPDAAVAIPALLENLDSRDAQRWYRCCYTLGRIGSPAAGTVARR